jgi:hypothetical protein
MLAPEAPVETGKAGALGRGKMDRASEAGAGVPCAAAKPVTESETANTRRATGENNYTIQEFISKYPKAYSSRV